MKILTGYRIGSLTFLLRVVSPEMDARWRELDWNSFSSAPVAASLSPHQAHKELKEDRLNRLNLDPAVLEARRGTTGLVTKRVDGPTTRTFFRNWYAWWSG